MYYALARDGLLGFIPFELRVLASLCLMTGKRPKQIADSKFLDFSRDVVSLANGDERPVILWNVPVVKQHGQTWRQAFNSMPIISTFSSFDIWQDLEELKQQNALRVAELFGIELTPEQELQLPLIMLKGEEVLESRKASVDMSLDEILRSRVLHCNGEDITAKINLLNSYVTVCSEITGMPLKLNAKRFRHTRATKLVLGGASIEEIANALDHITYRSAARYVDNLPVLAVKAGDQVGEILGVLTRKFAGLPPTSEDSDKVLKLYTKQGVEKVGVCGLNKFCNENYPIACYECELFQPNPFGNHAAVQEFVEDKLREAKEWGDTRFVENWRTILLAVLERRYLADQQRLAILNETPEILVLEHGEDTK